MGAFVPTAANGRVWQNTVQVTLRSRNSDDTFTDVTVPICRRRRARRTLVFAEWMVNGVSVINFKIFDAANQGCTAQLNRKPKRLDKIVEQDGTVYEIKLVEEPNSLLYDCYAIADATSAP